MKYSLYRKYKYLFDNNTSKDIELINGEPLFKSRNGYRHYYPITEECIGEEHIPFEYGLNSLINKSFNFLYKNFIPNKDLKSKYRSKILSSDCCKYIDFYTDYSNDKLYRKIKVRKVLDYLLTNIDELAKDFYFINNDINKKETITNSINELIKQMDYYLSNKPKIESDMLLVVSTHPYDYLSMSTDRRWTSCLNLDTNSNLYSNDYINDLREQHFKIVAYLIDKNDLNIKNPYARVCCYFYDDEDDYECFDNYSIKGMYNDALYDYIKSILKNNYGF